MSRILVCGVCPLPFENTRQNQGPGIRTWQLAWSLAGAGHDVRLVAMEIPGAYGEPEPKPRERIDGVELLRLKDLDFLDPWVIRRILEDYRPEAVVGATLHGSYALARCRPELPFWADQFGHGMAEAQARAALDQANWPVAHFWKMVRPIVSLADRISAVSESQRLAVVGELGALGRLCAETSGYEFTAVIPCALTPSPLGPSTQSGRAPVLRGHLVPEDAFVVLWSGGFNVWSDVETLFAGVDAAMAREARVHFVSTGAAIEGHDTRSYGRFEECVAASPRADRYHLRGWIPHQEVHPLVREADLGVLAERPIYEGRLGSKNRVVQWMGAGLPVACNTVGDLGQLLGREELGLGFAVGDADALRDHILWAAGHPEALGEIARRAREHAQREFSLEATTRELKAWADAPSRAPDSELRRHIQGPGDFADLRQRVTDRAERMPFLGSSRWRELWRRLVPTRRSG